MVHLEIDPHSGVPVYRQMMDQIKYYVASGVLKVGDRLPSIREMARTLSVNPTTVVKAYGELAHEGALEMRHGKGAFVTSAAPGMSAGQRIEALRRVARQLVVEARQMGASDGEVLKVVRQLLEETSGE